MKCSNCGYEAAQDYKFCEKCGAPAPVSVLEAARPDGVENKLLSILKDKLFFIICILFTVSSATAIVNGGIPVFNILFTIFFWLIYTQAQKDIVDAKHLRCVSGTVYANYVVVNVVAIILMVCGVIVALAFGLLAGSADFIDAFLSSFGELSPDLSALTQALLAVSGWFIGLVIVLVGVASLVINLLGMRKLHLFAKSVYKSVLFENDENVDTKKVKGWLIFFAVCQGVSALSSLATDIFAAASEGCLAAIIILAIVLLNKYFAEQK